jgi:rRNA maturation endonuclease Nob1
MNNILDVKMIKPVNLRKQKGYKDYIRTCKRCKSFFRTYFRYSKVCDVCNKNGRKKIYSNK